MKEKFIETNIAPTVRRRRRVERPGTEGQESVGELDANIRRLMGQVTGREIADSAAMDRALAQLSAEAQTGQQAEAELKEMDPAARREATAAYDAKIKASMAALTGQDAMSDAEVASFINGLKAEALEGKVKRELVPTDLSEVFAPFANVDFAPIPRRPGETAAAKKKRLAANRLTAGISEQLESLRDVLKREAPRAAEFTDNKAEVANLHDRIVDSLRGLGEHLESNEYVAKVATAILSLKRTLTEFNDLYRFGANVDPEATARAKAEMQALIPQYQATFRLLENKVAGIKDEHDKVILEEELHGLFNLIEDLKVEGMMDRKPKRQPGSSADQPVV